MSNKISTWSMTNSTTIGDDLTISYSGSNGRSLIAAIQKEIDANRIALYDALGSPDYTNDRIAVMKQPDGVWRDLPPDVSKKLNRYSDSEIKLTEEEKEEKIFISRLAEIILTIRAHDSNRISTDCREFFYNPLDMTMGSIIDELITKIIIDNRDSLIKKQLSSGGIYNGNRLTDTPSLAGSSSFITDRSNNRTGEVVPFAFLKFQYWNPEEIPFYYLIIENKCINLTGKSNLLGMISDMNRSSSMPQTLFGEKIGDKYRDIPHNQSGMDLIMELIYEFHDDYYSEEDGDIEL